MTTQYITYAFVRICSSDGNHIKVKANQLYLGPNPEDARIHARAFVISVLKNKVAAEYGIISMEEYQEFILGPYDEVCYYIDAAWYEVWIARRKGSP